MGCSASKTRVSWLLQPPDDDDDDYNGERSFSMSEELKKLSKKKKKKFGRSQSVAPLMQRSFHDQRELHQGYNYDHNNKRKNLIPGRMLHYDYHVVALTSSTYGIMKLVELAGENNNNHHESIVSSGATANSPVAAYNSKLRKSESMPAAPRHNIKALTTWTEMAMGLSSKLTVDDGVVAVKLDKDIEEEPELEDSVKNPLRLDKKSESAAAAAEAAEKLLSWEVSEEEDAAAAVPETINTWELMAGLDDQLTPRGPSPLPGPSIKQAEFASKAGKRLSRSRSLSSIEGLNHVADIDVDAVVITAASSQICNLIEFEERTARNIQKAPAGPNFVTDMKKNCCSQMTSMSISSNKLFSPALADHEEVYKQLQVVVDDDDTLFDPDILASFASSMAGSNSSYTSESASESDETWCRDGALVNSTSASFQKAEDHHVEEEVTSQWISRTESNAAQDNLEISSSSSSSSSASPDAATTHWFKLSFAKITPIDATDDLDTDFQELTSEDSSASKLARRRRKTGTTTTTALTREEDFASRRGGLEEAAPVAAGIRIRVWEHPFERKCPPGGQERVVLYSTSLRGIRKTYVDCNRVRTILQSYVSWIDERDVSLHVQFRNELKKLLEPPGTGPEDDAGPRMHLAGPGSADPLQSCGGGPPSGVPFFQAGPLEGTALQQGGPVPGPLQSGPRSRGLQGGLERSLQTGPGTWTLQSGPGSGTSQSGLGSGPLQGGLECSLQSGSGSGTLHRGGPAGPRAMQVPRVFIMGYYIGGVEEVVELHKADKLSELVIQLPAQLPARLQSQHSSGPGSCYNNFYCCNGCGGVRFVPCPNCNGSCKIVIRCTETISYNNEIIRCPDCNENGLIRCPICF